MKKTSDELRKEILELTRRYHDATFSNDLVPGEDYIPTTGKVFNHTELNNLIDASLDFWLTEGRYNERFEKKLEEFFGLRYAITVNSGSSANLAAFYSLTSPLLGKRAIKPGDEVIEVATCFPTTLNPVIQFGCKPVLVDVSIPTYNALAKDVIAAVTKKTKAVFLAHTLGNPFEVKEIADFCKANDIWLIEDACDAFGATYRGKKVGTFGHLATLSFYPAHQITCGEGGAVLTNSAALEKLVRSFRDWGRDCWCPPGHDNTCGKRYDWKLGQLPDGYDHKYIYSHIGFNLKLTDMQAAVGVAQMRKVKSFIKARKANHTLLKKKMKKFEKFFVLPEATKDSEPSWFGFVLTIKKQAPFTRSELVQYLEEKKIATRLLFGGNIIKQPAYQNVDFKIKGKLTDSDLVMHNTFWIGCYPRINNATINYVVATFEEFLSQKGL